jgi:hypothetical protein
MEGAIDQGLKQVHKKFLVQLGEKVYISLSTSGA